MLFAVAFFGNCLEEFQATTRTHDVNESLQLSNRNMKFSSINKIVNKFVLSLLKNFILPSKDRLHFNKFSKKEHNYALSKFK